MAIYKAFWRKKAIDLEADSSYEAQKKAAKLFNAKRSYEVAVVLLELDGKAVAHSAQFAGE